MKEYKKIKRLGDFVFYSHNEVLKEQLKSKKFRKAYAEEIARLNLVRQIRELRIARKLTQKTVAKRANMPQSVVARLESGEHSFSLDTLQRIAFVYGKEVRLVWEVDALYAWTLDEFEDYLASERYSLPTTPRLAAVDDLGLPVVDVPAEQLRRGAELFGGQGGGLFGPLDLKYLDLS